MEGRFRYYLCARFGVYEGYVSQQLNAVTEGGRWGLVPNVLMFELLSRPFVLSDIRWTSLLVRFHALKTPEGER